MPNGNTAYWDVLEHKGASAIIPVDEDGKIILVRQYRGAIDDLLLEIPAGGRDSLEEDFLVCAARELEEEIGYRSDEIHHLVDYHSVALPIQVKNCDLLYRKANSIETTSG